MPDMTGVEVALSVQELIEQVREQEAARDKSHSMALSRGASQLKIPYMCCCTAYGANNFKRKALEAGMQRFITKPISIDELKEVIQEVL